MTKQLRLNVSNLKWGKQRQLAKLANELSTLANSEDNLRIVEVVNELLVNFSDWKQQELDELETSEILAVFEQLKGENLNPPLVK